MGIKERIARIVEKMLPTDERVIEPEEIADRILSLEIVGKITCNYPELCENHNQINKTKHCDECSELRTATISDLIK